uniref:Uncharacterized protein n=1 Tax=Chromera velia CCMP2878 TaxID=1169474 RepID=A0A0G4GKD2_9ALVE|eukprot:Cvel_22305.t1-p1 / transcript=Cvel_22305.t1 / gene=Cvel_22305 / organism=Chromera_velia_CCMP2878 / gene_product=hypothetical protein / transcript_product=hypothetical protein / location=Cvel_scaffold2179:12224-19555(-) / protein_length=275 / sequence_SO=supercontig / SO=protein_coding / is_pseudo=false
MERFRVGHRLFEVLPPVACRVAHGGDRDGDWEFSIMEDCTFCGDGILQGAETCEPEHPMTNRTPIFTGGTPSEEGYRSSCTFCGDAVVQEEGGEACDPPGPGCQSDCSLCSAGRETVMHNQGEACSGSWILGEPGQSCTAACSASGLFCDACALQAFGGNGASTDETFLGAFEEAACNTGKDLDCETFYNGWCSVSTAAPLYMKDGVVGEVPPNDDDHIIQTRCAGYPGSCCDTYCDRTPDSTNEVIMNAQRLCCCVEAAEDACSQCSTALNCRD